MDVAGIIAELGDTVYFHFGANDTSGSGGDGASPAADVRECGAAADAAPVLSPTPALLTNAEYPDGCHEIAVAATAGNGFAAAKAYAVFCTLAIDAQNPTGFVGAFSLVAAGASPRSRAGSGVVLADAALTAAKFDGSTAFPLASEDAGNSQVARTGADGDTLEDISDELAGLNDLSAAQAEAACDAALASYDPPTDAEMDAAFAGLHNLSQAQAQTAAAAALTAYDPPTDAEMDAAHVTTRAAIPTAAQNADAVWDEAVADHTGATTFGGKLQQAVLTAAEVTAAVWNALVASYDDTSGAFGLYFKRIYDRIATLISEGVAASTIPTDGDALDWIDGDTKTTTYQTGVDLTDYDPDGGGSCELRFIVKEHESDADTEAAAVCWKSSEEASGSGDHVALSGAATGGIISIERKAADYDDLTTAAPKAVYVYKVVGLTSSGKLQTLATGPITLEKK